MSASNYNSINFLLGSKDFTDLYLKMSDKIPKRQVKIREDLNTLMYYQLGNTEKKSKSRCYHEVEYNRLIISRRMDIRIIVNYYNKYLKI